MRRSEPVIWLTILALFLLVSQLQEARAAKPAPLRDACSVKVRIPQDDSVYSNLVVLKYNKLHMTCPVNVRRQSTAKIYILRARDICSKSTLFGYPVISRQLLTDDEARRSYNQCSGVIPVLGDHKYKSRRIVTYLWNSQLPKEPGREREMNALFGKVVGGLMTSGLPVTSFYSVNDVFCFELDAAFNRDPLTALRSIGIKVPDSVRQTQRPKASCRELFHVK